MNKTELRTVRAPKPVARYSQGIRVGNTVYVQGTIALDPNTGKLVEGGIAPQTERVFESLSAILGEAGMTLADVVKVTAFLADLKDYPEFNAVYARAFPDDPAPVRTTVQAKLPLEALVEIELIAAR